MRIIILLFISCLLSQLACADGVIKLKLRVTTANRVTPYYFCINHGCYKIPLRQSGQVFLIDSGKINELLIADTNQARLYEQAISSSCHATLKGNANLTVSGHLVVDHDGAPHISGLRCSFV